MGIVADFVESGDAGWDVSRQEFLATILKELPQYPMVVVALTGNTTALLNRTYIRVKAVNPTGNGSLE